MPWTVISLSTSTAGRGKLLVPPSGCRKYEDSFSSVVASWLMASRPRSLALSLRLPFAPAPQADPFHSVMVVAGAALEISVAAIVLVSGQAGGDRVAQRKQHAGAVAGG